jgi:F0F1-type ATP synthase membrane subunit b/b'
MNNGDTQTAGERLQSLLEAVTQQRDARCAEILEQARDEARQLVRQAWRKARTRLHHAILRARQQFSHQLVLQQASQAARRRQARFHSDSILLEQSWTLLRSALERRWQDPDARGRWIETLTRQAQMRLVKTGWHIEHPSDWPDAEREATARRLHERLGEAPAFSADPSLQAGIRVRAGDTVVDGSCAGLLRDRVHIEALLLAAIRDQQRG